MTDQQADERPDASVSTDRWRLRPEELDLPLDPAVLGFRTTAELEPLDVIVGQERAIQALTFGLSIHERGYNVFVTGVQGIGRKQLIQTLLEARAKSEPPPDDWAYVFNFDEPDCPLALRLPGGTGVRLRDALEHLVEHMRQDLPAALKAKDFGSERARLSTHYGKAAEALFQELVDRGRQLNMAIRRMPDGMLLFVPMKDGKLLEPPDVEKLGEEERKDLERRGSELGEFAADILARQQDLSRQLRDEINNIVRTFARRLLDPLILRIKADHPAARLATWLDRLSEHLLDNLESLQEEPEKEAAEGLPAALRAAAESRTQWLPYRVNVVADNARTRGAPVVVEISPTYKNLFGTIEHDVNLFGRVTTDFTRIKPGSLLRASGGYLILDLEDAITEPLVWKQLKRTLQSGQLLTDVYEPFSLVATALKPEPIALDTKVVVLASPDLYYLLQHVDADCRQVFKVRADFDSEITRTPESHRDYARFVARQAANEGLPPFDAAAVAEIIRFGSRAAAHRHKLSVEFGNVADVVREAGHWARIAEAAVVGAVHVRRALEQRVYRSERIAARIRELIAEGTLRIAVEGSKVGQVNGLAVLDLGDYSFGRPSRVTASVGVGHGGIVNIERESDLSGGIHDKGVLILEGYLRNRYARTHPLALSASLAFEQSYGWIEGDSASSAELYCLLSAIADVPLRQDVAVTGSVNQHGEVQAVGGVNEKIEGFFDVCREHGLTGSQGVCIPRGNVVHVTLRPDVAEMIRAGRFHVWAVDTIDEGTELLTGMKAGAIEQEGTFHHRLDQRLRAFLEAMQEQPVSNAPARVYLPPAAPPKPAPPPLPGESG